MTALSANPRESSRNEFSLNGREREMKLELATSSSEGQPCAARFSKGTS